MFKQAKKVKVRLLNFKQKNNDKPTMVVPEPPKVNYLFFFYVLCYD